jgi:hypothetical protein
MSSKTKMLNTSFKLWSIPILTLVNKKDRKKIVGRKSEKGPDKFYSIKMRIPK